MVTDLIMHSTKKILMKTSLSYECNQLTGTQWVSVSNLSKVVFQLIEGHSKIIIYYSFVKKMTILTLHYLGRFNHFLEVIFLQKY